MKKMLPLAIGAALLAATSSAFAITDEEGNASLQFNFSAPGARSLAMGGAFIGLADDATAAFSNPAGLVQLAAPEISMEYRSNDYTTEFVNGGSFSVDPFSNAGLTTAQTESEVSGVSYLSYVMPHEKWAVAVYRHEFLNFETSFRTGVPTATDADLAVLPFSANIDVSIVNYGLAGAFQATDQLSLGMSINSYELDLASSTQRFASINSSVVTFSTGQVGDDAGVGFSLGGQYRINDQWQLGLVYRMAPEFKYTASLNSAATNLDKTAYFNAPDTFGIGAVYRPSDALTLALDVSQVFYSELTDEMQSNFRSDAATSPEFQADVLDPLNIDDGVEVRLGAEYTLTELSTPFSIRAGIWRDPDHSIQYEGAPDSPFTDAYANAVLFSSGKAQTHFSVGFGWAFEKVQIDAAFDASDNNETMSISGVVRF
jgi:long-subunit fatty acid transport protein